MFVICNRGLYQYNTFNSSENCPLFTVPTLFVVFQCLYNKMSIEIGAYGDDLSAIVIELTYPCICVLKKQGHLCTD
jgi:hypothetical protein